MKSFTYLFTLLTLVGFCSLGLAQVNTASPGPVFEKLGPVYDVPDADLKIDANTILKAIFDVDRRQKDPQKANPVIASLHRYYNMHVRAGHKEENIKLAFVLHGGSAKDALSDEAYQKKYGCKNPNRELIQALAQKGVAMFICGQSAYHAGYSKRDLMPEIKMALSAMTVLTLFQQDGYAFIKF